MIFTIKKHTHKSFNIPRLTLKKEIKGYFNFISGVPYKIKNQKDTNKLIGLSDALHHHKDSVRIGWRYIPENDFIEISAIVYSNKKRTITKITEVHPKTFSHFSIKIDSENYIINVNNKEVYIPRTSKYKCVRYILYPYFGGKTKTPKKIKIKMDFKIK